MSINTDAQFQFDNLPRFTQSKWFNVVRSASMITTLLTGVSFLYMVYSETNTEVNHGFISMLTFGMFTLFLVGVRKLVDRSQYYVDELMFWLDSNVSPIDSIHKSKEALRMLDDHLLNSGDITIDMNLSNLHTKIITLRTSIQTIEDYEKAN